MDVFELFDSMVAVCPSDNFHCEIEYRNHVFTLHWLFEVNGQWANYRCSITPEALATPGYMEFQLASASDEMGRFVHDEVFGADCAP